MPAVYSSAPLRSSVTFPESFYFEDSRILMYNVNKWNAFCLPAHVIFLTTGLCSSCEMGECILPLFQWCPGKYLKPGSLKASKPGTKSKHKQANNTPPPWSAAFANICSINTLSRSYLESLAAGLECCVKLALEIYWGLCNTTTWLLEGVIRNPHSGYRLTLNNMVTAARVWILKSGKTEFEFWLHL